MRTSTPSNKVNIYRKVTFFRESVIFAVLMVFVLSAITFSQSSKKVALRANIPCEHILSQCVNLNTTESIADTESDKYQKAECIADTESDYSDTAEWREKGNKVLPSIFSGDMQAERAESPYCTKSDALEVAECLTYAESAVLIEAESGKILFAKNAKAPKAMASTTKIVTALTVIRNCDLNEIVTVDKKAVGIEGSSIYLQEGEQFTVRDLLYGLMLQSGNDSAVALAIHTAGSVEKFCELMQETARFCGAENSSFKNPHGLSVSGHFTTAEDLAKISTVAMQNADFCAITATKSIQITNSEGFSRYIANKNKLLSSMDGANGVKTGYTKVAGRCFVGGAKRGNMQLVAVVLNCGPMFEDAKAMLEYGFANYERVTVAPKYRPFGYVKDGGRVKAAVTLHEVGVLVKKGAKPEIQTEINDKVEKQGEPVGELRIFVDNQLQKTEKIYTIR
ncbi:MAG: D-alanyl-D-alanine carboxypeptidase [Clostridia bacterium]|nr:D-alanyl-D-alanine carboxypeptidase [Clostridia bacterium]